MGLGDRLGSSKNVGIKISYEGLGESRIVEEINERQYYVKLESLYFLD
jgi:hypothetical protein